MPDHRPEESQGERWKKIIVHEFFEYVFNFTFLAFFLIAFAWYRRLILASYHIQYTGYWAPLVEAAILAKVIMIGDALRLGRRLRRWPLVIPTIYRTIVFSVLVVLFSVVEHMLGALWRGKPAATGLAELMSTGWPGFLAWWVLIVAAFLPFFTVKEIELAFGSERVRGLFFRWPEKAPSPSRGGGTNPTGPR